MQENQPLFSSNFIQSDSNPPPIGQAVHPSLLLRQYRYVNGNCTFSNSRTDLYGSANALHLPQEFESETLGKMDELLTRHNGWFFPFYLISLILSFVFSLVGTALPTFVAAIYILFYDLERRRKLRQNLQSIIDQQNELYFKKNGLLLVLNPLGMIGRFDLGGSWQLNLVSNTSFVDNGLSNMKIYEITSTMDSKHRLFNGGELPSCISERFRLSQTEWFETVEEINRIYLSENEMEERWLTRPLYWYLFACSLLFNLPILITFPIPIVYYLIVKFAKIDRFKKSNALHIDNLVQEHNHRIYEPKGLRLNLYVKKQVVSITNSERVIELVQLNRQ